MKSNLELLEMYKEEKALVIGGPESRTGLEPYPTFGEWKDEYVREYNSTHDIENPLTMEEAVALADAELADDDDLLPEEDLKALAASEPNPETEEEDETMTETTTTTETTVPATVKKPATKKAAAPATVKKPTAKAKPAAVKKPAAKKAGPNKTAEAAKVFNRMYPKVLEGKKARKDVIDEMISKVGLTSNGASTYYQKLKAKFGS